jgi:hypothetical protein
MRFKFLIIPFAINSVLSLIWMGSLSRIDVSVEAILTIMSGMLTFGFDKIITLLTSPDMILFLVISPLTFAIIGIFAALAKDSKEALAVGFTGSTPIITGVLYFSNLTYAMAAIFLVLGSTVAALITFKHARNFKQIPAYATGSDTMKKIILSVAIGTFLATYMSVTSDFDSYKGIIKDSMSESLESLSSSLIPGGGSPQGIMEQQLRSPEYKQMYINTMGNIMNSMFSLLSQESVVSPIVNQSLDRGALITALSLSGQELNDSPSAIIDVLLPIMRERTKNEIKNYFLTSGDALSSNLKEQTEADYDTIVDSMLGESDNTSVSDFITNQSSGMIDNLLDSGPLSKTLTDALPIGLSFMMFSLITLVGSIFLSPIAGL